MPQSRAYPFPQALPKLPPANYENGIAPIALPNDFFAKLEYAPVRFRPDQDPVVGGQIMKAIAGHVCFIGKDGSAL